MPDAMPPPRPSNYADALRVRRDRLAMIHAVLQFQREHYMLFGEFPSAEQVAEKMGLLDRGERTDNGAPADVEASTRLGDG